MRIVEGVWYPLPDAVALAGDLAALIRYANDAWADCGPQPAIDGADAGVEEE